MTRSAVRRDQFVRPVPGAITSAFGPRTHPILGYVRMHTGLDFRAPYGQAIALQHGGTVILAGSYGGYGNTVVIDHGGGVATLYAHQSSFACRGTVQQVSAGAIIGYVGSTGLSTGPHLHFEVRVNGSAGRPVRRISDGDRNGGDGRKVVASNRQGAARLRDPRDRRVRDRPAGLRGQEPASRPGAAEGRLRRAARR